MLCDHDFRSPSFWDLAVCDVPVLGSVDRGQRSRRFRRSQAGREDRLHAAAPRHRNRNEARESRPAEAGKDAGDSADLEPDRRHRQRRRQLRERVVRYVEPRSRHLGRFRPRRHSAGADQPGIPEPRARSAASKAGCRCSSRSRRPAPSRTRRSSTPIRKDCSSAPRSKRSVDGNTTRRSSTGARWNAAASWSY